MITHILINFPTETREDFMKSVNVSLLFDERMFITYSDNPLTLASKIFPKVEKNEQEIRIRFAEKVLKMGYKGLVVGNGRVLELH